MQLINPHTYSKLGFDTVLRHLRERVYGPEARAKADEILPGSDPAQIQQALQQVQEFVQSIRFDEAFPAGGFASVGKQAAKLAVEGAWLSTEELFDFLGWLRGVSEARRYLEKKQESYPALYALVQPLLFPPGILAEIDRILDERGQMRDNASPELLAIRKRMQTAGGELRNVLTRVLRRAIENNWTLEKEVAFRNDRLVIPIRSDARQHIAGFVQDVSQTGSTLFIEPAEALALNNELRELQIREHNEIVRILQAISAKLHAHAPQFEAFREAFISLDLIRGKARLAIELDANLPQIEAESRKIELKQAYYPPLQFRAKQEAMQVVPLDLHLDQERRVLVISGPNAGGKSVSLKTVGLLQLMLQAGFLVPASELSIFPIFDALFLDIGDEQSVESDLSTYTSRLYQWRIMGDQMTRNSLFLIDEFGSGTDPKQGAAIAEAFLERFVHQQAFGIITTHYGNLKDYAEVTPGVVNGAMQFDTKELKPTYRLIEGLPGRSYALEMAQRVGVHPSILKKARKKMGSEEVETEQLLRQLEQKNSELSRLLSENRRKEDRLSQLTQKYESLKQELEQNRKQLLRDAKAEARQLILQANKQIENTIREIREKQAEPKVTQRLRQELAAAAPAPEPEVQASEEELPELLSGEPIAPGDWVRLRSTGGTGQVLDLQGKKAIVEAGEIRLTIPLSQLDKIRPPRKREQRVSISISGEPAAKYAKTELDVLGKRPEEAIPELDRFVDEACRAGLGRIRVLHGKGTGALREALRRHLAQTRVVAEAYDAPIEEGGSGWTIIELKY
jgi:DNA mismatch repair protein MutS2